MSEVLVRAVELVEETWNNVGSGRLLNPLSLRRMVLELLAEGIEQDGLWQSVSARELSASQGTQRGLALNAGCTDVTLGESCRFTWNDGEGIAFTGGSYSSLALWENLWTPLSTLALYSR